MRSGHVYFASAVGSGRIKVGFSTRIEQRMLQVSAQARSSICLLGAVAGTLRVERQWLIRFEPWLAPGPWGTWGRDWFEDCGDVRAMIEAADCVIGPAHFVRHTRETGRDHWLNIARKNPDNEFLQERVREVFAAEDLYRTDGHGGARDAHARFVDLFGFSP